MKVKKILALVLALAMVFALAAPAFAAPAEEDVHDHVGACGTGETIQPQVAKLPCCGADDRGNNTEARWDVVNYSKIGYCVFGCSGCNDNYATKYYGKRCTNCGTALRVDRTESGYYCPTYKDFKY